MIIVSLLFFHFLFESACSLSSKQLKMDIVKKGVTYDGETGTIKSCLFCNIVEKKEAANIVYEDSRFIIFNTIAPASKNHLLISPKKHIQNFAALSGPADALLLRDMMDVSPFVCHHCCSYSQLSIRYVYLSNFDCITIPFS